MKPFDTHSIEILPNLSFLNKSQALLAVLKKFQTLFQKTHLISQELQKFERLEKSYYFSVGNHGNFGQFATFCHFRLSGQFGHCGHLGPADY